MKDTYKTIDMIPEPSLYKEKGSKFYGYAFPVTNEEEIEVALTTIKAQHHKARHWCYAWQIGSEKTRFRVHDDGEPSNSAGQPIYGQIVAFDLTNILVVVVRYFGGVKLGVGGLVRAYKTAAQWVLEQAEIVTKTIDVKYRLQFDYKDMNKVQRIIKQFKVEITGQNLQYQCQYDIRIRKGIATQVIGAVEKLRCVKVQEL